MSPAGYSDDTTLRYTAPLARRAVTLLVEGLKRCVGDTGFTRGGGVEDIAA